MSTSPIVITAALTGPIAMKADNPALPITPEELAIAAEQCYKAGAAIVHLHIRDEKGAPTVNPKRVKECLDAIHARVPEVLTQLSTGGFDAYEERAKVVEVRPRMASLNPCTMSFGLSEFRNPPKEMRKLAARMRELGVKPELEIYDYGHLGVCLSLLKEGLLAEPLQFSIVLGVPGGAAATPQNLVNMVANLPTGATWQVVAVGRLNLELTTIAVAMGGNARTGLEDTLYLRKGVLADNASLVARLVQVCKGLERPIATPAEAVKLLQLPELKQA
jgi:3-keto-5-aminohexanoate cleavage enzyme